MIVRRMLFAAIAAAAAVVGSISLAESRQTTGPKAPPFVIPSMYGRDLFEFYCASCHGRDGKGGGPAAPALKTQTPDLTTISQRHGGAFPTAVVAAYVANEREPATPAHGSKEMPVWGPIFRGLDPNEAMNRARIDAIVSHVASMQRK